MNQAYIFLMFIINGILLGIIFDMFRVSRRSFKTSDMVTYIEDIAFWIISGVITLYFIFFFNNGQIRLYIFLGIILGVAFYILTLSKYFIKINVAIIGFIKEIVSKVYHIIAFPFLIIFKIIRKTFFKPISFISINLRKLTKCKLFLNFGKKDKKSKKIAT